MIIDQRQHNDILQIFEHAVMEKLQTSKRSFWFSHATNPNLISQTGVSITDTFFKVSFYIDIDVNNFKEIVLYAGSCDDFENDNTPKNGLIRTRYNPVYDINKFVEKIVEHFEVKI